MQLNDYLISFDGQLQTTNHANPQKKDGILIYTENQTTIIEYHDKTRENINQFTVEYTTRYNHNTNQILLVDCIDFNKNNNYTAMIETNTLPLESITDTFSDLAVRYQLARQYQYTGDITTSTYNQITNNNIPTIRYTRNNKDIFTVDGEPVFDNFIYNPNIIKTSVTINDKNTDRSFVLSHKDYEDILSIQQTHNQTLEQLQNMTYQYTGAIESYAIVKQIINYDKWVDRFNDYQEFEGDLLSYTTFLISLKTIEFYDEYSDSKKEDYGVIWNRTSFITMECFINASKIIINSYNPDMGVVVSGRVINKVCFRLETSSKLSIIESELINIIRNRTGNRRVNSTISIIANKIQSYNVSYVSLDNLIIIYDEEDQMALSIDLETGLITDYVFDEYNEYGHESYEECPNCMFMTNTYLMQGTLNVNTNNYNFSEDNSYENGESFIKFLYSVGNAYKIGFGIFKEVTFNLFLADSLVEIFYDLHYQSLVKQLNGEESWTYKDSGYCNIYD
ncbi:MAG: hypothetical protein Q4Q22_08545, partial [Methanosphaera sp.]|nr:hypothetical protein [Methanosphaera sp.]